MGDKPFFEFNVLAFTERDAETLGAFAQAQFEPTKVRSLAEDIIHTGKLTKYVSPKHRFIASTTAATSNPVLLSV